MHQFATNLRIVLCCLMLLAMQLAACASSSPDPEPLLPLPDNALVFSKPGTQAYQIESGTLRSSTGCTLTYNTYRPEQLNSDAMVVLAHGLYRNKSAMRGWAAHWASYGVPVTMLSFCNASLFNPKVERNAADLQFLANSLHQGPVLYAGYSAGGLAAWLAAGADDNTLAYLGLESVDSDNLATTQVPAVGFPALLLVAEPAFCNANNNMVSDVNGNANEKIPATVFRVSGSTHCNFAHPFGSRCSRLCGTVNPASDEPIILEAIRVLATAWVLEQTTSNRLATEVLSTARQEEAAWQQRIEYVDE